MSIPTYDQMLRPILELACVQPLTRAMATKAVAEHFKLTEEQRAETIPSGAFMVGNRAGWAMSHLHKAGLTEKVVGRVEIQNIAATLKLLEGQLKEIEAWIEKLIVEDAQLSRNRELLMSIPGIGKTSATRLLAELPEIDSFQSARQMCAYAGLTPRERKSGTSVNGRSRMCKQGRAGLRELMFMPALSLMRATEGPLARFAQRLVEASKKHVCVVGALMRKLMGLAFAILRSGKPYDPHYRSTPQAPATA